MLTKRQNLLETIRGGNPDRFVNQYEFMEILRATPVSVHNPGVKMGGPMKQNEWGVWRSWPEGLPGGFPVHDEEHFVIKDITKWRDVVKAPKLDYPQEEWDALKPMIDAIDRNEVFATYMVAPGIFEQLHHLQGMDNALLNFYEEPEATHELIDYLVEYELALAERICTNYHPDAIFHHDDWGSYRSSFLSPPMFEEFIVPAFIKIYGYYKDNGVELIVHHSDSYVANLAKYMPEMQIDILQGCTTTNNVPELVKEWGPKGVSWMGDLDNGVLDKPDISRELIASEVRRACEQNGKHYFIPNLVRGLAGSTYPGVYEAISEEIDKMSKEMF